MPVLAMRGNFFFPNIRAKVEVSRSQSLNAIKFALENGGKFFLVSQVQSGNPVITQSNEVYTVGVIAEVVSVESATPELTTIYAQTIEAAKIVKLTINDNILFSDLETVDYVCNNDGETRALFSETLKKLEQLAEFNTNISKLPLKEFAPKNTAEYLAFTNVVANETVTQLIPRQEILEETSVDARMEKICAYILSELDMVRVEKRIANRVKQQVQDGQKEYYLREQMKAISAELGDDANEKQEYVEKIKKSGMPEDVDRKSVV